MRSHDGLFLCGGFGKQLWLLYKFTCAHIGANENEAGRGKNLQPSCLPHVWLTRWGGWFKAVALPLPSRHETLPRLGSVPLISWIEGLAGKRAH